MATAMHRLKMMPRWMTALAYGASFIYLHAQLELFATVVPGTPVWDLAGFVGSTLVVWSYAAEKELFGKYPRLESGCRVSMESDFGEHQELTLGK